MRTDAPMTPAPQETRLDWGTQALWQQMHALLPGVSVEVLAHADSTNTRLLERMRGHASAKAQAAPLRATDAQPCLLVAEHQTGGRGRLGRTWHADPGASLTFSLGLPLAPADWSGLALAVGVALADALDPAGAAGTPRIGLKWPNDLWLLDGPGRGRKLGGILIETLAVGARRMAVVGVGLNVLPLALPVAGLASGYGCLAEIDQGATAPGALARVAEPLVRALLAFEHAGFAPVAERFTRRDLLRGQPVTTTLAAVPSGLCEGVDARGGLLVRDATALHVVSSGEVSIRPLDPGDRTMSTPSQPAARHGGPPC